MLFYKGLICRVFVRNYVFKTDTNHKKKATLQKYYQGTFQSEERVPAKTLRPGEENEAHLPEESKTGQMT